MNGTALLVIDVQTGAFDGKSTPAIDHGDDLLIRISSLIDAARVAHVPVVFVQHCAHEGQLLIEGSDAWELHSLVKPELNELIVHKRSSSAFDGTDLHKILQQCNVDTIITCGIQSEHCVSNTGIAALDLGMKVFLPQDGHSTWSTDDENAAAIIDRQNVLLAARGATVKTTAEIESDLSVARR